MFDIDILLILHYYCIFNKMSRYDAAGKSTVAIAKRFTAIRASIRAARYIDCSGENTVPWERTVIYYRTSFPTTHLCKKLTGRRHSVIAVGAVVGAGGVPVGRVHRGRSRQSLRRRGRGRRWGARRRRGRGRARVRVQAPEPEVCARGPVALRGGVAVCRRCRQRYHQPTRVPIYL